MSFYLYFRTSAYKANELILSNRRNRNNSNEEEGFLKYFMLDIVKFLNLIYFPKIKL